MENLGFNINKLQCMKLIGNSLAVVSNVCARFQEEADMNENKGYQSFPKCNEDLTTIVTQLLAENVFNNVDYQSLNTYKNSPLLQSVQWEKVPVGYEIKSWN